jgi:hypothetical protein
MGDSQPVESLESSKGIGAREYNLVLIVHLIGHDNLDMFATLTRPRLRLPILHHYPCKPSLQLLSLAFCPEFG